MKYDGLNPEKKRKSNAATLFTEINLTTNGLKQSQSESPIMKADRLDITGINEFRGLHSCQSGLRELVLGRSSIIIDNQLFISLILINRLQNWQSIIIGKGDT